MIIAVDLGRSAGLVAGADRPLLLQQQDFPEDLGSMMSDFEGFIRGRIREFRPTLLCWERPFLSMQRMDAQGEIRTQRLYGQAAAMAKLAREYEIKSLCERPQTVRKKVVGNGRASAEEIMRFCAQCGQEPSSDHVADAYVLWRFAKDKLSGHPVRRRAG